MHSLARWLFKYCANKAVHLIYLFQILNDLVSGEEYVANRADGQKVDENRERERPETVLALVSDRFMVL